MEYIRALSIAGSDSSGGAGIQADIKTFSALGCYGMSVVCAVTAQNTQGVVSVHAVPPECVREQLEAVLTDIGADVVKIGMLGSAEVVRTVAETLRRHSVPSIVLDPVMVAKGGHALIHDDAVEALKTLLLPMATVVTPNLPEAAVLTGLPVGTREAMPDAGRAIVRLGARAALVKGGHLGDTSDDCLVVAGGCCCGTDGCRVMPAPMWFKHPRIQTPNTHGTGCTLSSAIAAHLAKGYPLPVAVKHAADYVAAAIRAGADYRLGHGHGPVHHFHTGR